MKEKEEDEERNENICRQTLKQRILNSKTEAHSNPLWSVDRLGAGQYWVWKWLGPHREIIHRGPTCLTKIVVAPLICMLEM